MIGYYCFIHDWPMQLVAEKGFWRVLGMRPEPVSFRVSCNAELYRIALYFEEFWTSGVSVPRDNRLYTVGGRELHILKVELAPGRLRLTLRAGPLLDDVG